MAACISLNQDTCDNIFFPLCLVPSVIHQEVNPDRSPNHFQLPGNLGRGAK